ncbi:glycosyltransferase [Teichococcus oryzae]|uniref:Glycosyltransferase family 4 protein n=1 Tax=Teichococcus oryzae TaxID=1608942 RepID=A0A5B2THT8_9PROT|nr:glycosyltransferase [Pseudoroseomonas oryzae]KAA2213663.1 glycosyltransferase family 4 protein [Pseudoroseomonas oryzae]
MSGEAGPDAEALRREADSLRDRGQWQAAAAAYAAFLRLRPDDVGMQVQQAHCLKELGEVRQALGLYHAAWRARPLDADIPLQIGHAEKLLGQRDHARAAYAAAVALDPGGTAPWAEWVALVADRPDRAAPRAGGMVLDLTDLTRWIREGYRAPSGIQRVQIGIAAGALAGPSPPRLCALWTGGLRDLPAALFHRIAHLMSTGTETDDPSWREATGLLEVLLERPPPLRFDPGAVLVPLGGTWGVPGHLGTLRAARLRDGLRQVPLVHDCVPLMMPEYCQEGTVSGYSRWFANLALHADGVLTVSRSTRDDLRRLHRALLPELPVPRAAVVRMDAAPAEPPPHQPADHPLLRGDVPFVLFVATMEGRKDHRMVFSAWLALLRRLGARAMPLLACVGKPGWRAEPALSLLEHSPELRARVRLLHDVSDPVLAALYRRSLFTIYNSLHEGWGLPVTESLAAGRAVVVPAHSALVESGQGGATFFTPGNEPELVELLGRMITDPAFRAAEQARAAAVPLRPWGVVAAQLLAEAARLAELSGGTLPRLPLAAARRHPLRRMAAARPNLAMAVAEAVREGEGWYPLEDWGAWTRPGAATLHLPLDAGHGGALRLELDLRGPAQPQEVELHVMRDGGAPVPPVQVRVEAGARLAVALAVPAGGADLRIDLHCQEAWPDPAGRPVGIGVEGFAFAAMEREEERLALLEARHFHHATALPEL